MTPRRLRRSAPLLAVVTAVIAAVGCGVSVDSEPRPLARPGTTTTTTAAPATGQYPSALYFLAEGELTPLFHDLPSRSAEAVVSAVIDPDPRAMAGLTTAIPVGTTLLSLTRADNVVTVDLSEALGNVVGLTRQQAVGQIVMSVTDLPGVDTVRFKVEGRDVTVSSPVSGDQSSVGACDFQPLLASLSDAIDREPSLPVDSIIALNDRIESLREQCPSRGPG